MKYFLAAFLFCSPAFAWEMTFQQRSHIGAQSVDIASEVKGEYFFAGRSLGKKLPPPILLAWQEMAKGPPPAGALSTCPLGEFTFTKKDSQVLTSKGCISGPTFGRYVKQLETVRNFAKGL